MQHGADIPGTLSIGVVTNPHSKKNRRHAGGPGGARRAALEAIVGARGVVRETRSTSEIGAVVQEFTSRGVRFWVSDGGDGALHWLLNETRKSPAREGLGLPLLVPTNGGTIDFVAKKVGIRGGAASILERLARAEARGAPLPVEDVPTFVLSGVRVVDGRDEPFERLGFLAAIAGIGQRFFDVYYRDPMPGAVTIAKVIARGLASIALQMPVARALPGISPAWRDYAMELLRPHRARVRVDGRELPGREWRAVHVGAMYSDLGGIVRLFPLAGGGRLHVMAGNPSMAEVARCIPNLVRGRPLGAGIEDVAATSLEVEAEGDELLAPVIDGEPYPGVRRLRVEPGPRVRIPRV